MRVKIRDKQRENLGLPEHETLIAGVESIIIEVFTDDTNQMIGYAEFHSSNQKANKEVA